MDVRLYGRGVLRPLWDQYPDRILNAGIAEQGMISLAAGLAAERGCETVAFPLISSGVYGYPKEEAFRVATEAITAFLADHDLTVYLVLFDRAAFLLGDRFGDVRAFIDDAYAQAEERRPRNQASYRWEREPRALLEEDACAFGNVTAPKPAAAPRKNAPVRCPASSATSSSIAPNSARSASRWSSASDWSWVAMMSVLPFTLGAAI